MSLSTREKVLIGLFLVLGCVFLFDQYVFQPMTRCNQQLNNENSSLSTEIQANVEKSIKYKSLETEGLGKQEDYQEMLNALPDSPMISDTIDYLETRAQENNVKLISIQYKENQAGNPPSQPVRTGEQQDAAVPVRFQIVAHGSHYDLLSFVLALENAPRIYIINGLKIGLAAKERSAQGLAALADNAGISAGEPGKLQAAPETFFYDRGKSVLNLDFNAYYHTSPADAAAGS
jgi:Pilus assembly protein, PilO.